MEISIGYGKSLLNDERMTDPHHKELIQEDLDTIAQRRTIIHARLEDRKEK